MRSGLAEAERLRVGCREMVREDGPAVARLLTHGFRRWRDAAFWQQALRRLAEREVPAGLPRFGYVLEANGTVVGALLVIGSELEDGPGRVRRCNVSSWYVEPAFRMYGTLLVHQALRHRDATYLNVSPAPETWPLLEAQGYRRYVGGRTVAFPLLARGGERARVRGFAEGARPSGLAADEARLLREHAGWGCLSVVCETASGVVPFVFGMRRRGVLPFAYLLYCRDLHSFTRCARALGRHLLRHGIVVVVADADERLPGIPGWHQDGFPKFYRGGRPPRPGDLAYTERAVMGV